MSKLQSLIKTINMLKATWGLWVGAQTFFKEGDEERRVKHIWLCLIIPMSEWHWKWQLHWLTLRDGQLWRHHNSQQPMSSPSPLKPMWLTGNTQQCCSIHWAHNRAWTMERNQQRRKRTKLPENNCSVETKVKDRQRLSIAVRLMLMFIICREDAFSCRCVANQNLK